MKSATFLSFDPDFDRRMREVIVARGGRSYPDGAQVTEHGADRGMFNYFGKTAPELEWEFRTPPWTPADDVVMPDMAEVAGYYVECRWEIQFAEVAKAVAGASDRPAWVMDSDGVIWDAANVDPERVHL